MIPFILLSRFFDSRTEQRYLTIWYSAYPLFRGLGNSLFLYLESQLHWTQCMLIMAGLFLFINLISHLVVPEVQATADNHSEGSLAFLKEYLSEPRHFLLAADFYMTQIVAMNLLMWVPYYLDTIGVKNYAIILAINGLFFTGGSLFMEFLISFCTSSTKTITTTFVLAFMLFHVYWLLIP